MPFSVNVSKWAAKAGTTVGELHKAIILELFESVIEDTTVLQGRLRAN